MKEKYKESDIDKMTYRLYHGTSTCDPRIILKSIEGFDLKFNT